MVSTKISHSRKQSDSPFHATTQLSVKISIHEICRNFILGCAVGAGVLASMATAQAAPIRLTELQAMQVPYSIGGLSFSQWDAVVGDPSQIGVDFGVGNGSVSVSLVSLGSPWRLTQAPSTAGPSTGYVNVDYRVISAQPISASAVGASFFNRPVGSAGLFPGNSIYEPISGGVGCGFNRPGFYWPTECLNDPENQLLMTAFNFGNSVSTYDASMYAQVSIPQASGFQRDSASATINFLEQIYLLNGLTITGLLRNSNDGVGAFPGATLSDGSTLRYVGLGLDQGFTRIPEPGSLALILAATLAAGTAGRRRPLNPPA